MCLEEATNPKFDWNHVVLKCHTLRTFPTSYVALITSSMSFRVRLSTSRLLKPGRRIITVI